MLEAAKEFLVKKFVVALELSGLLLISSDYFFKQGSAVGLTSEGLVILSVHVDFAHRINDDVCSFFALVE